jgi:phospholipid-binding lipoprotein MlaA
LLEASVLLSAALALALTTAAPPPPDHPTNPRDAAPQDAAAAPSREHTSGDPFEGINRRFFRLNEKIDKRIIGPAARGYKHGAPDVLQDMLHNFVTNFSEPVTIANDALQLRPKRAMSSAFRFVVNTTVGLAGLFDAAKMAGVEHHDNDFGITLGRWGSPPGPYLYLPLLGPTTVRDGLGKAVDNFVIDPLAWAGWSKDFIQHPKHPRPPYYHHHDNIPNRDTIRIGESLLSGIDERARVDEDLNAMLSTATDPYATMRSVYLQNRASEVDQARWRHAEVPEFETPADAGEAPGAAAGTAGASPAPGHDVVDEMDAEDRANAASAHEPAVQAQPPAQSQSQSPAPSSEPAATPAVRK